MDGCIRGSQLESFLANEIQENEKLFKVFLSGFDADDLFEKWLLFIRCIDEFYNIPFLLCEDDKELFNTCSINSCKDINDGRFLSLLKTIDNRCGQAVVTRFLQMCMMLSDLDSAYRRHGLTENCCDTLGEARLRCQSMRLYYTTMLMMIPKWAQGTRREIFLDLLNVFQPQIDGRLVRIRTAYNYLLVNKCIDDLCAFVCAKGLLFNYSFNHLDEEFLEPLRMTVVDVMATMTGDELKSLPTYDGSVLYGYKELEGTLAQLSVVYDKYGINQSEQFKEIKSLAKELNPFLKEDYSIIIPQKQFNSLCSNYSNLVLWDEFDSYHDMLNCRPAFFKNGNNFYSTILLFQRYVVNEVQRLLERKKKFQIDSGFIFEKKITSVLIEFGFSVKRIKRISHKEFDVVCVKGDCIYNFQCKNNSISISKQGREAFKKTYSAIRRLNSYYEQALIKEDERKDLLRKELALNTVYSFVISRFPVITRNRRIICFNQLRDRLNQGI